MEYVPVTLNVSSSNVVVVVFNENSFFKGQPTQPLSISPVRCVRRYLSRDTWARKVSLDRYLRFYILH